MRKRPPPGVDLGLGREQLKGRAGKGGGCEVGRAGLLLLLVTGVRAGQFSTSTGLYRSSGTFDKNYIEIKGKI